MVVAVAPIHLPTRFEERKIAWRTTRIGPADAIGLAVLIGKITTGEVEDEGKEKLSSAAAKIGNVGGKINAEKYDSWMA